MWRWWATLAILPPVICFVISAFYVSHWTREIDAANRSIAENGGPGVVYLSVEQEDLRRIERQAMLADPGSVREDRAAIAILRADLDTIDAAYRQTPQYPGEDEAYRRVEVDRARFFAAVDGLLAATEKSTDGPAGGEARARALSAADAVADSMRRLVQINADQVQIAGGTITSLRRRTAWLTDARDALAFAFVVAGTLLGIGVARREAALAEERRRLDQIRVEELDAFAGRVAHDLNNLLEVIMMRAGLGEKAASPEDARRAHAQIGRQAARMAEILRALLDFARAAGAPDPGASCDLPVVVRQVTAEVEHLAAAAGVEVVVEPMPRAKVACNAAVLSVVVSNLARNAIKYIGEGRAGVRRVTLRARPERGWLRFEVEDTGPGLPPGAESRIFSPLVRLEQAAGKPGIGLGLATVKRLVEANGGEVGVTSRAGSGACFWFALPAG